MFSCYTGLRISDIIGLRSVDFYFSDGEAFMRKTTKKTGAVVNIPIMRLFGGKPYDIVKKYMANEKVFGINLSLVTRHMPNISEILGKRVTFHTARHTCATMLAEKTGNPMLIKAVLGHSDISMSMKYIHESKHAVGAFIK